MARSSTRDSGALRYMAPLDGLRGVAVASVMIHHFLAAAHPLRRALGALLALAGDPEVGTAPGRDRLVRLGWRIGAPALVSLVFVSLVGRAADGMRGRAGALLGVRPLVRLGTISYAVYLFHNFVPLLTDGVPAPEAVRFLLDVAITIGLATMSWVWLERPINALKRRLPYVPSPRAAVAVDGAALLGSR